MFHIVRTSYNSKYTGYAVYYNNKAYFYNRHFSRRKAKAIAGILNGS